MSGLFSSMLNVLLSKKNNITAYSFENLFDICLQKKIDLQMRDKKKNIYSYTDEPEIDNYLLLCYNYIQEIKQNFELGNTQYIFTISDDEKMRIYTYLKLLNMETMVVYMSYDGINVKKTDLIELLEIETYYDIDNSQLDIVAQNKSKLPKLQTIYLIKPDE